MAEPTRKDVFDFTTEIVAAILASRLTSSTDSGIKDYETLRQEVQKLRFENPLPQNPKGPVF